MPETTSLETNHQLPHTDDISAAAPPPRLSRFRGFDYFHGFSKRVHERDKILHALISHTYTKDTEEYLQTLNQIERFIAKELLRLTDPTSKRTEKTFKEYFQTAASDVRSFMLTLFANHSSCSNFLPSLSAWCKPDFNIDDMSQFRINSSGHTMMHSNGHEKRYEWIAGPSFLHRDFQENNNGDVFAIALHNLQDARKTSFTGARLENFLKEQATRRHVFGSFAYLLYYPHTNSNGEKEFIVTEIQSDEFQRVKAKQKEVSDKVKDWHKDLLKIFEDFSASLPPDERPQRIRIVGKEFLSERWPAEEEFSRHIADLTRPAISSGLVTTLYKTLPQRHGYKEERYETQLSERYVHVKEISITTTWYKAVPSQPSSNFVTDGYLYPSKRIQELKAWAFEVESKKLRHLETEVLCHSSSSHDAKARIYPINPFVNGERDLGVFLLHLFNEGSSFNQFFSRELALPYVTSTVSLSVGPYTPISLSQFLDPDNELPLTLINRERSIVLKALDDSSTLTIKGSGYVRHENTPPFFEIAPDLTEAPIRQRKWPNSITSVPTQQLWGGMTLDEVEAEAKNLIHLWLLAAEVTFEPALPYFKGVLTFTELPVSNPASGEVKTLSLKEYQHDALLNESEVPAVLLTESKLDVRITDAFYEIMGYQTAPANDTQTTLEDRIQTILTSVYEAYGETLQWPDTLIEPNEEGMIGQSEILLYLHEIGRANKKAGQRILDIFEERVLTTLGFIHGSGGHLGGILVDSPFPLAIAVEAGKKDPHVLYAKESVTSGGAFGGGASFPRNMDVFGTFHDIDGSCKIPDPFTRRSMRPLRKQDLSSDVGLYCSQYGDLWGIQECILAMRLLLRGSTIPLPGRFEEEALGVPFKWNLFYHHEIRESVKAFQEKYLLLKPFHPNEGLQEKIQEKIIERKAAQKLFNQSTDGSAPDAPTQSAIDEIKTKSKESWIIRINSKGNMSNNFLSAKHRALYSAGFTKGCRTWMFNPMQQELLEYARSKEATEASQSND